MRETAAAPSVNLASAGPASNAGPTPTPPPGLEPDPPGLPAFVQARFVDIFLEELAKIGGEDLKSDVVNAMVQPFINELAKGEEERLCQHIEERIFHHLVRPKHIFAVLLPSVLDVFVQLLSPFCTVHLY